MARSKRTTREPSKMVRVDEAMEILSVSKSTAYHTIQKFNNELRAKGYEVPRGRVPRSYFMQRCGLRVQWCASAAGRKCRFAIPAIRSKDCGPQGHSFGANRREMGSGFDAIWCVSISAIIGQNWNFMVGGYGGRTERPSSSGNAAGVKKRNILCASARSYPQC